MSEKTLSFAIFGNEFQPKKSASVQKVMACLQMRKARIWVERTFYNFLTQQHNVLSDVTVFDDNDFETDYAISLGGDGTFLKTAAMVGDKKIPILGVNMGRLGFLSDTQAVEIEMAIECIYTGNYRLENHAMIQVECDHTAIPGPLYALNDIAILKRDTASMITIHTHIDGEFLANYQADGLVVSTPTGSTAYGLSNGGPVMVPNSNILCLTPVAPHSLTVRPIVISDNSVITLDVESRSHNYLIAIDGRSVSLSDNNTLTIRKAPFYVQVLKMPNKRYFSTLREKMLWGADQRSE